MNYLKDNRRAILKQLQINPTKENILRYYHNYRNIITLLLACLQKEQCFNCEEILHTFFNLKKKYKLTDLLASIIRRVIRIELPLDEIMEQEDKPFGQNSFHMHFKALAESLQADEKLSEKSIVRYLKIVNEKLQNNKKRKQSQELFILHYEQKEYLKYTTSIKSQMSMFKQKFHFQKHVFNCYTDQESLFEMYWSIFQLFNQLAEVTSKSNFINSILEAFGTIIYFQTVKNSQTLFKKSSQLPIKNDYSFTRFKNNAYLCNFKIKLSTVDNQQQSKQNNQQSVRYINLQQAFEKQNKLSQFISQKISGFDNHLWINYFIYNISNEKLNSKDYFQPITKSTALQLLTIQGKKNMQKSLLLTFAYKKVVAKQIKSQINNQKNDSTPKYNELFFLNLINKIKSQESLKRLKINYGFQTDRELVGLNRLTKLYDSFYIPYQKFYTSKSAFQQQQIKNYAIFQQSQMFLAQKEVIKLINKKSSNKIKIIFEIFKQIFQGLYCLHQDMNNLYTNLLKESYNQQQKQEQKDCMEGTDAVQKYQILHRDLSTNSVTLNIFNSECYLSSNQESFVKIGIMNYGCAELTYSQQSDSTLDCGNLCLMAPEMRNKKRYSEKTDIWCVGMMLYELLNKGQKIRFSNCYESNEKIYNLEQHLNNLINSSGISMYWIQILRSLLSFNPLNRKTAKQMLLVLEKQEFYLKEINEKQFIESYFARSQYIFRVNGNILQIEQNQFMMEISNNTQEWAIQREEKKNIKHLFLRSYLHNFTVPLFAKLPIICSVIIVILKIQDYKDFNVIVCQQLIQLIEQTQVFSYEKNGQMTLLIKLNQKQINQKNIDRKLLIYTERNSLQLKISQQFLLVIKQNNSQTKQQNNIKLILSQRKYHRLNEGQQKHSIFAGYDIQIGKHKSFSVLSSIYKKDTQNNYFQYCQADEIVTTRSLQLMPNSTQYDIILVKNKQIDIKKIQKIIEHVRLLLSIITNNSNAIHLRLEKNKLMSVEIFKHSQLIKIGFGSFQDNKSIIQINQHVLLDMFERMMQQNANQFFESKCKKQLKDILTQFAKPNYRVPYQLVYTISLIYWCKNVDLYKKISKQLKYYSQSVLFLLAQLKQLQAFLVRYYYQYTVLKNMENILNVILKQTSFVVSEMEKLQMHKFQYKDSSKKEYEIQYFMQINKINLYKMFKQINLLFSHCPKGHQLNRFVQVSKYLNLSIKFLIDLFKKDENQFSSLDLDNQNIYQ